MTCEHAKKNLKPFLDDLLSDREYRDMCVHLETCAACRGHIRSISSLSNQLWKMGKIQVPGDLAATITYACAYAKEHSQSSGSAPPRKYIIVAFIAVILAFIMLMAVVHKKHQLHIAVPVTNDAPIVKTEIIRELKPPASENEEALMHKLETIADRLNQDENAEETKPEDENGANTDSR